MAKYGKKTQRQVRKTMRKRRKGALKSGSGKNVKSREQAIAIALSESRKKGYKAPRKKNRTQKIEIQKSLKNNLSLN